LAGRLAATLNNSLNRPRARPGHSVGPASKAGQAEAGFFSQAPPGAQPEAYMDTSSPAIDKDVVLETAAARPLSRSNEVDNPSSPVVRFAADQPLKLEGGQQLGPFQIAYQTYGELNAEKSNAILVCHALTGDQYVASEHPVTGKPGWWTTLIGPGKPVDTNRFFVICPNIIGGCMGSTGPASLNPRTGKPYGLEFPVITIGDMVAAQARLIDHFAIDQLFCVTGGSMGGMQVLQWAAKYKERVFTAVPIATAPWHTAQNIAFHEVGRQAVMADPNWRGGNYYESGIVPKNGLAVARMAAHITYLSETALQEKFGRSLQKRDARTFSFDADFQVESYLRHQGSTFVDRFDANSYLYITRAMDYFDLAAEHGNVLANAFRGTKTRFCVVSFTSDWLYPTRDNKAIVKALNAVAANVSFVEVVSDKGHDAFLLDEPEMFATVRGFVGAAAEDRGIGKAA
jgi:homoserine O-acetyltransferase